MEYYHCTDRDYDRQNDAFNVRQRANVLSRDGPNGPIVFGYTGDNGHCSNGDEQRFSETLLGSFTKGLAHDRETGLIHEACDFTAFVSAINSGDEEEISRLPLGPPNNEGFSSSMASGAAVRGWESMAAGLAFNLQGPDPQRTTMPPAPQIDSLEAAYEMSELYWMALLRDTNFTHFSSDSGDNLVCAAANALSKHLWVTNPEADEELSDAQRRRVPTNITPATLFRGTTHGDRDGPYLSQFLLVGTKGLGQNNTKRLDKNNTNGCGESNMADLDEANEIKVGFVQYGAQRIDQRVRFACEGRDYMTTWQAFIDTQNGANVAGNESYNNDPSFRFITTPRDLATYVHYDALYQAYLNACLIMLSMGVPYDDGMPFINPDSEDKQSGFALYGPPHILTLVTEVATRALKAVRFQKFNTHRRLRPEAMGGLVDVIKRHENENACLSAIAPIVDRIDAEALERIAEHNSKQNWSQIDANGPRSADYDPVNGNSNGVPTYLLPMAFAEGSPMHPSYGAGHATVAGACVTILKAFFKADHELDFCFVPSEDGKSLKQMKLENKLTVEGELNKVCSNISIGRDWAGVHWFSDYFESIRMGEEIALELLREQKLTYREESFSMTVPLFDGSCVTI